VLKAWGYTVLAASRRQEAELLEAGAEEVVDYAEESFSEAVEGRLAVVVDTLGVDADGLAAGLKKAFNAAYIRWVGERSPHDSRKYLVAALTTSCGVHSMMPSTIRRMQQQGLLQGASLFTSTFFGRTETSPTSAYFLPSK
jgi:D-arabinose 1-dehydrogenase-like Zn-dependent alcohol dehydrogenase